MTSFLPDAHFEQITVNAAHASEFEAFCQRNNIPFEVHNCDVGESTYVIDIDNDFATIPMAVTNKQIYRKNKFKPTEADHGYSGKYTLASIQDNISPLSMRALPKANTVPGLPLNVLSLLL